MSWRQVFFGCAVASLLFTWQVWLDYAYAGMPVSWPLALAVSAAGWFAWAPLIPLVEWLGHRWPLRRGRLVLGVAVHVPASVIVAVLKSTVDRDVAALILGVSHVPSTLLELYMALATYWIILGVAAALQQARDRREQEIREAQLEAELARARLDALKLRLQPHFLFNTLNALAGLMREDVEAADRMLSRLSDLLRLTLDRADVQEVPLKEELDFTRLYLGIQEARFGPRLTISVEADPDSLGVPVPSLVLQPLVENAFQHGVAAETGPVHVAVRASRRDGHVVIDVEDDGPGPPEDPPGGVGLTTTRSRLARLYGHDAALTLATAPRGGALATLTVPAREAEGV